MIRALDANGDIVTSGTQFFTEPEEVAQSVKSRLKLHLGEWFLNINDGVPWFDAILGIGVPIGVKNAILQERVVTGPNVAGITRWDSQFDRTARTLSIQCGIIDRSGIEQTIEISEG